MKVKSKIAFALLLITGVLLTSTGCTHNQAWLFSRSGLCRSRIEATLPQAVDENTTVELEILDEISCLNFNPTRYEMSFKGETTYYVRLPLPIDSIVKYRYILNTSPAHPKRTWKVMTFAIAWY